MTQLTHISKKLLDGLKVLGFDKELDETIFFTSDIWALENIEIIFHLERAIDFGADAVFILKQLNGSYKPLAYIYDYTNKKFEENVLTDVQRKIWSSGETPLACIFYDTEIKIIDCTTHINIKSETPVYLDQLAITSKVHNLYNSLKFKSGIFWEEEIFQKKFKFQNSAYDILIEHIRKIISGFAKEFHNIDIGIINKLIIQSILIKYLEERVDDKGNKLFSNKYFKKFGGASTYSEVLRKKGKSVNLFQDLNKDFNGNIFTWDKVEEDLLQNLNLSSLANALDGDNLPNGQKSFWRFYEFNFVPVELISRLYEEFLGENKHLKGLYYTPSHLAKLLVDEAMPLSQYHTIDLNTYKILDPACGSGIFLVIAYKRLVQWWRLQNKKENKLVKPNLNILKKLLSHNIYGVDLESQAVRLTAFSLCLALCDELSPKQIIEDLKFEDLTESNLVNENFFSIKNHFSFKFNLIIGNPPFKRGSLKDYDDTWQFKNEIIKIPQGQIALKFLTNSLYFLNENSLLCLIIKSSGLLYNSTSIEFKKLLFSSFDVIQILDFTALARNKSLWDNGADVAAAAIFLRNRNPDFNTNILHLTFRRTKATKERIFFEIDDYDLHFINKTIAITNNYIWKNNLLGGGRIRNLVDKFSDYLKIETYLKQNKCFAEEGFIIGTDGDLKPNFIFEIPTLPTESITEHKIDYSQLNTLEANLKFVKVPSPSLFDAPNIIIWENIGIQEIPIFLNKISFSFKHKIIGIKSLDNNIKLLKSIVDFFKINSPLLRFYIYSTSSQVLINKNSAVLKTDLMSLPFFENNQIKLSSIESNIINDVNIYMQDFLRHGEKSFISASITKDDFLNVITNYGNEFKKILNLPYQNEKKKFRLSEVVNLKQHSFIITIFKFDDKEELTLFHETLSDIHFKELSENMISSNLNSNRIIRLYRKNTIIIVKPNQRRYWLSLFAYRDADKSFADLSKLKHHDSRRV